MRKHFALQIAACFVALAANIRAQTTAPPPTTQTQQPLVISTAEPGSQLTLYLLTFGWGDVAWERFGHNAIWIRDRARGTDITYNWGMFDFNQPHFVWRFVTGDTKYWMQAFDLNTILDA